MPKVKPLRTSEYLQFVQSTNPDEVFLCPTDAEGHTTEVKPVGYSIETNMPEEKVDVAAPAADARVTAVRYRGKNGNFLRITNIADFIPKSDAALVVRAQEYRLAQQLGITKHTDQSLTARVIGLFGDYRFRVLKDQEQYHLRTTLFHEKEAICQNAFLRLYALQIIERTFGRSWADVIAAIAAYKLEIAKIQTAQRAIALQNGWQDIMNILDGPIGPGRVMGLREILRDTSDLKKKIFLRNYISVCDDLVKAIRLEANVMQAQLANPDAPNHPHHGLDATKFPIEQFVRSITNQVVDDSKLANELITIANGKSAFRGVLEESLGKAEKLCVNYTFNQNHLIEPEHQGDYSRQERVTILSSHTVGDGREDLRKFLLASSYILNCEDGQDPFQEPDENFDVKPTRGWTRLFRKEGGDRRTFRTYEQLRRLASKANISRLKTAAEDFSDVGTLLTQGLSKAFRGMLSAFGHEFYKVGADFIVDAPAAKPDTHVREPLIDGAPEQAEEKATLLTDTEFRFVIDENWDRWSEKKKINYIIDTLVKGLDSKHIKLSEQQKRFIDMMRKKADAAPLALPPSQLGHTDPDDFLSSITGGLETFYGMFDEMYEINPCIALYCSLLYVMGGLAAVNPSLATSIFEKINMSALAQPFIAWNTATAQTMTSGTMSNFISAGFTAWQEFFFASKALSQAGDSVAGDICRFMSNHFAKAIGGVAAAYGLGYFVTTDLASHIPGIATIGAAIKEDAGNKPFIEEFFAGVKLGTLAYEALHSKPEGQSAAANVVSFALKVALFPVRLFVTSPANLVLAIWNSQRLSNAAKPWVELYQGTKSLLLRGADVTLRLLNLAGQATKRMVKTVGEWLANTLTIVTKFIAMPFVDPKNNKVSEWFITAKTSSFAFFGKAARGLKDAYRWCRNGIARELRPVEHTDDAVVARRRSSSADSIAGLDIDQDAMRAGMAAGNTAEGDLRKGGARHSGSPRPPLSPGARPDRTALLGSDAAHRSDKEPALVLGRSL